MQAPQPPENEQQRVHKVHAMNILDTAAEERFDRLTRLTRHLFEVPGSLISLVDEHRQWIKSSQGIAIQEIPRDVSFSAHAILQQGCFLVENASLDERFSDNPLVIGEPNILFYAAWPLKEPDGYTIGTLSLFDTKPRAFEQQDQALLEKLSTFVESELAEVQYASLDELTGISNRQGFMQLSALSVDMCKRRQRNLAVIVFDLDDFSMINQQFGHQHGDEALQVFAQHLQRALPQADLVARLENDQFVALFTNTDDETIERSLVEFQEHISQHNHDSDRPYEIYYSAGHVCTQQLEQNSVEELIIQANAIMYEKKQQKLII